MNTIDSKDSLLEKHFQTIEKIILSRQDPITGLLPASTAITAHGDYTDAWVRDNVYSILSVWGLALAYKKHDPKHHRSFLLSQSVVKLMRALLTAMMRQSDRVEAFKNSLNPIDSLHAKYGTNSGLAVVGDDEWGHLQLDASSLFLLMSAQMIASGLEIIYTMDEVNFIQNMVHYISRSYCTPDFGIWERGNKINHGTTEINASSIGMAKAALEAMNNFNLFPHSNSYEAVIHVVSSDIARSRFTLHGLLPRESNSKETDAALLSIIGYPAYAIEDENLVQRTRDKIVKKLAGNYGCKRFLLDGHQSSIEDSTRLHYEPSELREFEDIESEWPLFFTYLLLDAIMREDQKDIQHWQQKLEPLFVEEDNVALLPELYIVPLESIEAEKLNPGSQKRIPNENIPLVWAQSLYMLSEMILDGILLSEDIDPLRRREKIAQTIGSIPMVPIMAENDSVKKQLLSYGYKSETLQEIQPLKIMHASELSKLHTTLGKNKKLGLSGRPLLVSRTITTARLHILDGEKVLFLPYYFNPQGFYFSYDNTLLVEHFRASLKFLSKNWDEKEQPILPLLVREDMLIESRKDVIFELLDDINNQQSEDIKIRAGSVHELVSQAQIQQIDYIDNYLFNTTLNLETQSHCNAARGRVIHPSLSIETLSALEKEDNSSLIDTLLKSENRQLKVNALNLLQKREGSDFEILFNDTPTQLSEIMEVLYASATACHDWSVIRRIADMGNKFDERIEDVLLDIIVRQKQLAVGRAYSEKAIFSAPLESSSIIKTINEFCGDNVAESVLTQEILLHLGHLIRTEPELFNNFLTLRTWYFVQLLVGQISRQNNLVIGEAYEHLLTLAPHEIYNHLRSILRYYSKEVTQLIVHENLSASGITQLQNLESHTLLSQESDISDWAQWRHDIGMLGHFSEKFYKNVWHLLYQCNGLIIGDKYSLENRLGAELTKETTAGERTFELRIDTLLQKIYASDYRQLNIELLESLIRIFRTNPDLNLEDDIVLDVVIGHAVRLQWEHSNSCANYDELKAQAWEAFYKNTPHEVDAAFVEAFLFLLTPHSEVSI